MNIAVPSDTDRAFNVFRFQRARRHISRLKLAGVVDIAGLAAHAVMTGDKFLAVAIMAQLSAVPTRERARAIQLRRELENVILGPDTGKALEAIALARARGQHAEQQPRPER